LGGDPRGGKTPIEIDKHLAEVKQNYLGSVHGVDEFSAASVPGPNSLVESIILDSSVGRAQVCGQKAGWQGATTPQGHPLEGGATPPGGLLAVHSGA
jgi:hypothetical protein